MSKIMKVIAHGGAGCWPVSLTKSEKPEPSTFEVAGCGAFGGNACKVTFLLKTPCGTMPMPNGHEPLQLVNLQIWRLTREQAVELIEVLRNAVNPKPTVTETP